MYQLLAKIDTGFAGSYEDFTNILADVANYAAAGDKEAQGVEEQSELINNNSALEAVRPTLLRKLRAIVATNNCDSKTTAIKAAYARLVEFVGYKTLSGYIPKVVYTNLLMAYHALKDVDTEMAQVLRAKIHSVTDSDDYIVSQYNADVTKDDYLSYITPYCNKEVVTTKKTSKKEGR